MNFSIENDSAKEGRGGVAINHRVRNFTQGRQLNSCMERVRYFKKRRCH